MSPTTNQLRDFSSLFLRSEVGRWLKKTGDFVKQGEALLEVETDKANVEVVADFSGVLKTSAKEGEVVQIGATVAQIDETAASAEASAPAAKKEEKVGNYIPCYGE